MQPQPYNYDNKCYHYTVWNVYAGCERCSCDLTGSVNSSCDITTGNCYCQPGVGGRRCDECMQFYYGFSSTGCRGRNLPFIS